MPFSLHSSLSFASMELWKVLFKVFVQNANDKSLVFASAPCVSAAASEASAAAVVSVLLEELHPANIAAIMQIERPAAVNLCMDKTENPNKKDREEQEDFWLTLEPLPVPDPEKPSAPHED